MKLKSILVVLFSIPFLASAGKSYSIKVQVFDVNTDKPIAGAQVYINDVTDVTMITDSMGIYVYRNCKEKELRVKVVVNDYGTKTDYIINKKRKEDSEVIFRLNRGEDFTNIDYVQVRQDTLDKIELAYKDLDFSQNVPCDEEGEHIWRDAEFPGGQRFFQSYIALNVVYPEAAIEMEDQGKVYVSFIVEMDGTISDTQIVKGISKELDGEAKHVIRKMPQWVPGYCNGKPVRTRATLPIVFTLM